MSLKLSPKDKAIELVNKYQFVYIPNYTSKHELNQCALIAVDLILDELPSTVYFDSIRTYYEQVKLEIEKL